MSPSAIAVTAFRAGSPTQSPANPTLRPSSAATASAIGFSDMSWFRSPFGRPK
jgi:hypothetical protein